MKQQSLPAWPMPGSAPRHVEVCEPLESYPHDPNPDNWTTPGRPNAPDQTTHPDAHASWVERYGA